MEKKKKILIVFGTRPEAIKMAPVIHEAKKRKDLRTLVCVFRQHRHMLDQVLDAFDITPDFDLRISISDKDLLGQGIPPLQRLISFARSGIGFLKFFLILKREKPNLLLVQGDTSTAFLAAFLAFHFRIPIAHVEAGLRTYDKYAPFPEEVNRQLICRVADFHFAPTETARENLLAEHVPAERVTVTGNTTIDALLSTVERQKSAEAQKKLGDWFKARYNLDFKNNRKIILVTAHRRESFGEGLKNICAALKEIAEKRKDVTLVYPVHLNPNVELPVRSILSKEKNILLTEPLEYEPFVFLMSKSYLILTDSGGIQEEAPSLKKPVLVMREKTEREEGVKAGVSKLVGTKTETIVRETLNLLENDAAYRAMTEGKNPYGDGKAAKKIVEVI